MSNDELSQLTYLRLEIKYLQGEINRLSTQRVDADLQPALDELLDTLRQRLTRCKSEYDRCMDFINAIPDEWTRTVFTLRYVRQKSWARVGVELGLTSDCCKMMVYRYLKRYGDGVRPERANARSKDAAK